MNPGDSFRLGKYLVRIGLRQDNPAFPTYLVYLGHILIGKSFSMVDQSACEWLERQQRDQTFYAYSTEKLTDKPYGFTAVHVAYLRTMNRKDKPQTVEAIDKALAGG